MTTVTIARAADCLRECIAEDVATMFWGPPGVGKSEMIDQVAMALDMPVIDFRASMRDPVDLRGVPVSDRETNTTRWLCPAELPVGGR